MALKLRRRTTQTERVPKDLKEMRLRSRKRLARLDPLPRSQLQSQKR